MLWFILAVVIFAAIILTLGVIATWWVWKTNWKIVTIFVTILALVALTFLSVGAKVESAASQSTDVQAMKAEIKRQLDEANAAQVAKLSSLETSIEAISKKDIEQDEKIAALEGQISTIKADIKAVKAEIEDLKAGVKSIKEGNLTITASPADLTTDQVAQALTDTLVAQGLPADRIKVGTIDWSLNPADAGSMTFVTAPVKTQQRLSQILANPQNATERAVRTYILNSLWDMPKSERDRALSGRGFVPVQFLDETCFNGNTFYNPKTGIAERNQDDVCKAPGDVWWVYVGSDGKVHWDTAVRADCGNPGLTRPPRPKTPPASAPSTTPTSSVKPSSAPPTSAPPSSQPPTSAPPSTPSGKNPSDHPVNNGNAPSPSTPAPSVSKPATQPSSTPSSTYAPAPAPTASKSRTATPTQSAPPTATASASFDPCTGPNAAENPACGG